MFIHGTYARQKKRGLAADVCPRCAAVRPFLVSDHFLVAHVYFIPVHGGTYQGSSRDCQHCRLISECRPSVYDRLLSEREVAGMTEEQFVVATNPGLALPEPQRSQWIEAVIDLTMFGGDSIRETLPQMALNRLHQARVPSVQLQQYAERLAAWTDASLTERLALLTEVAAAVGGGRDMRVAHSFTQGAMQAAPNGAGCLLGMPLGLLLGP
jgi:hypothetical protein